MNDATYSLSTMWAQRFDDIHTFVEAAARMGYDAVEVSHATQAPVFERLLAAKGLRLSSIHAPAPKVFDANNRANSALNLAALDDDERRLAIDYTKASIDHAAASQARFVVVHLGAVGDQMLDTERSMRRLFDSGTRDGPEIAQLREETFAQRAAMAPPYVDKARETLEELAGYARERGVAIGLENRLHYHEIPQVEEALELVAEFSEDLVGYWHDVGHAEVQARLGYVDKRDWLDALGPRTLGAHLHDVDGIGDHRAPGHGDVEWQYIAAGLPPEALRVFEIDQGQPLEAVAAAIGFLRERGVVP